MYAEECGIILFMKNVILASASPRRQELLKLCGIPFSCIPADIDETIDPSGDLKEEIMRLSFRKAESILRENPDAVVIGSDTIVVIDGEILGKPVSEQDAERMLEKLSGRTNHVITGLCILSGKRKYLDCTVSDVMFAKLSEEEIRAYVQTGECMDKAGAYAVQGLSARFITGICGDYYSVMGFPLHLAYEELKNIDLY